MSETISKLRVKPSVVASRLPDGTVLVDSATGECFELNRVGARVWERLEQGEDPVTIVDALAAEYSIERSQIAPGIAALMEDLARHGILLASR